LIKKRSASVLVRFATNPRAGLAIFQGRNQDGRRKLQMKERYLKWCSPWLNREFEMLPFGSGGGLPLIIFSPSLEMTIRQT
jgi:hypothetical protein